MAYYPPRPRPKPKGPRKIAQAAPHVLDEEHAMNISHTIHKRLREEADRRKSK